jgi:hypothetical protein
MIAVYSASRSKALPANEPMSGMRRKRGLAMPVRGNDNDHSHEKAHEDNVKLLIALRRALGTHAKTPTQVQAVGVRNVGR